MALLGWEFSTKLIIDIPGKSEELIDFPVLINLSEQSGETDVDISDIFNVIGQNDSFTKLLIKSNNSDGDTKFLDFSNEEYNITAIGNAQHKTTQSKFGSSALYFDGSDSYLSIPDSSDWNITSDTYTIDFWAYCLNVDNWDCQFVGQWQSASVRHWFIGNDDNNKIQIWYTTDGSTHLQNVVSTFSPSVNNWFHVAVVIIGLDVSFYVNGTAAGTGTFNGNIPDANYDLTVGGANTASAFNGYIDELRISKGIARWTSDFTPPSEEYHSNKKLAIEHIDSNQQCFIEIEHWDDTNKKAILYTKIPSIPTTGTNLVLYYTNTHEDNCYPDDYTKLLVQSNSVKGNTFFRDSSSSRHNITAYGNVLHSTNQSKFGNTSIYFDGDGDYLNIQDHNDFYFGSSDFTIDFFIYVESNTTQRSICGQMEAVPSAGVIATQLLLLDTGSVFFRIGDGTNVYTVTTASSVPTNSWVHIGCVRDSDTLKVYINGVVDSTTESVAGVEHLNSSQPFGIGSLGGNTDDTFNGYIDELRISKGIARWTSNFTPPVSRNLTGYVGEIGSINAQSVWDDNFVSVYHMTGTGNVLDSTSNIITLTNNGTTPCSNLPPASSSCRSFGSTNDGYYLDGGDHTLTEVSEPTLEILWAQSDKSGPQMVVLKRYEWYTSPYNSYVIDYNDSSDEIRFQVNSSSHNNNVAVVMPTALNTYGYYCLTHSSSTGTTGYINGISQGTVNNLAGESILYGPEQFRVGAASSTNWDLSGSVGEVRLSNVTRSADWVKATSDSLLDTLLTFTYSNLDFSNFYPTNYQKQYGMQQVLKAYISSTTFSGSVDVTFYNNNQQVSPTLSGIPVNSTVEYTVSTVSGIDYNWYLVATAGGIPNMSDLNTFYVRYLCSGICTFNNSPISGVTVNLHRRTTGELIGTTTSVSGIFKIDTNRNEYHYAVALHDDLGINALVYDKIKP